MLHTPVRSSHPWLALLTALSTLLLLVPMISIVGLVAMIITQTLPELPISLPTLAIVSIALPCVPFLFFARLTTCPVCHIRIFRFSRYSRHRGAHYLPLLGYNMATALHLLFRAFYVCPGCGTPVKLLGTRGMWSISLRTGTERRAARYLKLPEWAEKWVIPARSA